MVQGVAARRTAIVDLIYDAVLESALWSRVLEQIADLTASTGGLIHGFALKRDLYTFRHLGRIDPECKLRHEKFYITNPWQRSGQHPVGELLRSDEIIPFATLKRSAFYADVLAPQNIAHALTAVLAERPGFKVSINIERSHLKGAYTAREMRLIQSLLPHLKRASELRLRLEEFRDLAEAERDMLDLLDIAVVALDQSGCVVAANAAAHEHASCAGLDLSQGCNIASRSVAVADRLRKLVADVLADGAGGQVVLNQSHPHVIAQVMPARGAGRARISDMARSAVAALVILTREGRGLEAAVPWLSLQHNLTPAEACVAGALAKADPLNATARSLGISVNTLKTHAKNLYSKAGVRGQADLIRMMADAVSSRPIADRARLAGQAQR